MFTVNNRDTRTNQWRRSGIFIVNFEHIIAGSVREIEGN